MSDFVSTMEKGAEPVPDPELTYLSEDALISIILKLDLQSMMMLTRATKKLRQVVEDDLVWTELCQPWENLVNLTSWRAHMDSGKALYRLLYSLNKLVGLWSHRGNNPRGELVYVTWGVGGLEGWRVITGTRDSDEEVRFVKSFEVIGKPDGSHKVVLVGLVSTSEELPSTAQLSAHIVLPSLKSPNQFVMERHDVPFVGTLQNGNENLMGIARRFFSRPVKETKKKYERLLIGEPSPGQELTGLWTGLYGPHGWEILTISYTDDQFIVGTKVIGDPNVPAGEITFKGNMGQLQFDFPSHLRIHSSRDQSRRLTKMYRGQGRIAEENFLNPQWVQGLLLVEQSGNFYFVWADINSMISFHRLDVDASFRNRPTANRTQQT